jgi:hypothetical protein
MAPKMCSLTITPTAQAAANATDMAAALTTAKAISASTRIVVKQRTEAAEATVAADDMAIERLILAWMEDGGKVTAAATAAATIESVIVVPVKQINNT